jgi:hypothetical protein
MSRHLLAAFKVLIRAAIMAPTAVITATMIGSEIFSSSLCEQGPVAGFRLVCPRSYTQGPPRSLRITIAGTRIPLLSVSLPWASQCHGNKKHPLTSTARGCYGAAMFAAKALLLPRPMVAATKITRRSCLSDLCKVYRKIVHKSMISVAAAKIDGCSFFFLLVQQRRAHVANERDVSPTQEIVLRQCETFGGYHPGHPLPQSLLFPTPTDRCEGSQGSAGDDGRSSSGRCRCQGLSKVGFLSC